ncbi:MAG: hypothetical protein Q4C77_09015 [Eubacteriales bacterium]|nr:hypothetical protein [Eubacteriales bacterium]
MTKNYATAREKAVNEKIAEIKAEMKNLRKFSKEELIEQAYSYRLMTEGMSKSFLVSDIAVAKVTGYSNY